MKRIEFNVEVEEQFVWHLNQSTALFPPGKEKENGAAKKNPPQKCRGLL